MSETPEQQRQREHDAFLVFHGMRLGSALFQCAEESRGAVIHSDGQRCLLLSPDMLEQIGQVTSAKILTEVRQLRRTVATLRRKRVQHFRLAAPLKSLARRKRR